MRVSFIPSSPMLDKVSLNFSHHNSIWINYVEHLFMCLFIILSVLISPDSLPCSPPLPVVIFLYLIHHTSSCHYCCLCLKFSAQSFHDCFLSFRHLLECEAFLTCFKLISLYPSHFILLILSIYEISGTILFIFKFLVFACSNKLELFLLGSLHIFKILNNIWCKKTY